MIDTATSQRFLLLHALAIKGLASEAALAEVTGLSGDEVGAQVEGLVEAGLVRRRTGRLGGLALTDSGRSAHLALLPADASEAVQAVLAAPYEAFLPVNGRFKELCLRWQMRGQQPNDHSDADYDAGLVAELAQVHAEVTPLLESAAGAAARFGRYPRRLGAALDRVRNGDRAAFTKPLSESYHDIWMELHQDLLTSLGRSRNAQDEG